MIYATGGGAWQHQEATFSCNSPITCSGAVGNNAPFSFTTATNRPAPLSAADRDEARTQLVGRAEYRYTDYKSFSATGTELLPLAPPAVVTNTPTYSIHLHNSLFTVGLAYEFGPSGPLPDGDPTPMWSKPAPPPRRRSRGPVSMPVSTPASAPRART